MPKVFNFEKKVGWSELIAIGALLVSGFAICQSYKAQEQAKILNKIDFRPVLSLRAMLHSSGNVPAHLFLKNKGPVDATQIQVKMFVLLYVSNLKKVKAAATGSDMQWTIDKLPPLREATIKLDESTYNTMLPDFQCAKENRILEIRLTYRREVDLNEYSGSTFYFVSQEGKWVNENNSGLDPDIYGPIKEAAFSRFDSKTDVLDISDPLHTISK